jgi:hypothetical protein
MRDDDLAGLVRRVMPPIGDADPRRDLWPQIIDRLHDRPAWSRLDFSLAAAIVVTLLMFPEWLLVLAYYL